MSDGTPRRAADRLALLLEEAPADRAVGSEPTPEEQVLAELAGILRASQVEAPPVRPEFRSELREQLIARAREQQPAPPLLGRLRDGARRFRYSTAAVTGASLAGVAASGGGIAVAAEHAQPDDLLYDVKLALEDLRLTLTAGDAARGDRALSYALDRLAEARTAAEEGADGAAATALHGAADRTEEATGRLLATGEVEPVQRLAVGLSAQVAQLEALRPLLGTAGEAAADELLAVIVTATEEVLSVIDAADWPGGDVPVLPPLPVPTQQPPTSATPTPAPDVTTPAAEDPTPSASPSASATTSEPEGLLPGLLPPLPDPVPSVGGVVGGVGGAVGGAVGGVGDAVDDVGGGAGGAVGGATGGVGGVVGGPVGDAVEDVGGVVGGAVDDLGGAVGGAVGDVGDVVEDVGGGLEDVLDGVTGSVAPSLPPALGDTVEEVPGTVGGVVEGVGGVVGGVGDVVDGVGGAVGGLVDGLLGGG